ncbi:MAG: SpoIID/LytB domain-containing protein [Candidatus Gastranaerophilales bacterium]|nr:SpoIID/LytB domain-containing protein [Candidatus Gastranaerophilales bacterium]
MDRRNRRWNKSQRMQMKAFLCVLGLLLLLILLAAKILVTLVHRQKEELPGPIEHIPMIEMIYNVWVMEADDNHLLFYWDGVEQGYRYAPGYVPEGSVREQVADIEITDGFITSVIPKTQKVNGKILSADESGVEVEGVGRIPLAADYKGYRVYNTLEMCTLSDLPFGYDFTDLVLDNGEICALLIAREEAMEYIRVLLKASNFEGSFHEELVLTSDTSFTIQYGAYDAPDTEQHPAGELVTIDRDSPYFAGGRVMILPDALTGRITLDNVSRNQGKPSYRGHLELELTENGIVVVNELPLEEYLYCVVPSEMPSGYPAEALKAQAVCARTYAYGHMQRAGFPQYGAHVDDSTSYQVYNNILEQESTTSAVKASYGQLLFTAEGSLAETYYYSTSCGVGTDANVWKTGAASALTYLKAKEITPQGVAAGVQSDPSEESAGEESAGEESAEEESAEEESAGEQSIGEWLQDEEAFEAFIQSVNADAYEAGEGWYRWTYQVKDIDVEHMSEVLAKRYQANSKLVLTWKDGEYVSEDVREFTKVTGITVEKRGVGGICDELILETDSGTYKVISEHNIRYILNDGVSSIVRQDGSKVASPTLLPSGFFMISVVTERGNVVGYALTGGGFGHGVGMSQNGAKDMAKAGLTADEILSFFFDGCEVRTIQE